MRSLSNYAEGGQISQNYAGAYCVVVSFRIHAVSSIIRRKLFSFYQYKSPWLSACTRLLLNPVSVLLFCVPVTSISEGLDDAH